MGLADENEPRKNKNNNDRANFTLYGARGVDQVDGTALPPTRHLTRTLAAPHKQRATLQRLDSTGEEKDNSLEDKPRASVINDPWWRSLTQQQRDQITEHLAGRVESFKSDLNCKICLEKQVERVFQPCGHLACCVDCAKQLRECPICRDIINGLVVVSLPKPRKVTTLDVSVFAKRNQLHTVYTNNDK